jgi:hypothetical protein
VLLHHDDGKITADIAKDMNVPHSFLYQSFKMALQILIFVPRMKIYVWIPMIGFRKRLID